MKSKIDFKNLKIDYFLLKIFDIMKKNKALKIMKCNKELQRKLNTSVDDYKEYAQLHSSIEIEIKPDNNEHGGINRFINIFGEIT